MAVKSVSSDFLQSGDEVRNTILESMESLFWVFDEINKVSKGERESLDKPMVTSRIRLIRKNLDLLLKYFNSYKEINEGTLK